MGLAVLHEAQQLATRLPEEECLISTTKIPVVCVTSGWLLDQSNSRKGRVEVHRSVGSSADKFVSIQIAPRYCSSDTTAIFCNAARPVGQNSGYRSSGRCGDFGHRSIDMTGLASGNQSWRQSIAISCLVDVCRWSPSCVLSTLAQPLYSAASSKRSIGDC